MNQIKKPLCSLLILAFSAAILFAVTGETAVFGNADGAGAVPVTAAGYEPAYASQEEDLSARAGMEQAVPALATNGYEVYFGNAGEALIGNYNTLLEACDAVNDHSSGTNYTIMLTADDFSMGAAATIAANKTVTLTGAGPGYAITQANAGTRHITVNGSLVLENITLNGNTTGGGISVLGGTLEMNEGAVVTKCATTVGGCGISLRNSTFTMNGGEISDNHQSTTFGGSGGGISMDDSTVTMNGGIITRNSAVWGGGVEVGVESTFTMNGGEISYNKATVEYGGGVHVYAHGTFILNGGILSNNTVAGNGKMGGGVFVGQGSYASTEPTDWARLFINGGFVEHNSATYGGGVAAAWIGNIEMAGGTIANNSALAGGGVYLTNSREADNRVSFVMTGGEISKNEATGSSIYGGGGIYANTIGRTYSITVVIGNSAGTSSAGPLIYGNSAGHAGGIFLLGPKTEATVYDGRIYNNTADYGGGIALASGSALELKGGVIGGENNGEGNTAAYNGGGIYTASLDNKLSMSGGNIVGNTANSASEGGGGLYLADVSYAITGGEIRGNTATNNGGGIYITSSATASAAVSNTMLAQNKAAGLGGGAYIANAVEAKNVSISGNSAGNGGGVYVSSAGSFTATGATGITHNSAVHEGGGIYTEQYTGYTGNMPGDYAGVQAGDYSNITTNAGTVFRENIAPAAYEPPANADTIFRNIGYAASSILRNGSYVNPINNYDINYVKEPRITTVTILYDANGGTGSYRVAEMVSGSEYTVLTLADTGISRSGYNFAGWNTATNGGGAAFAPGDRILLTGNVTLYAQWMPVVSPPSPGVPDPTQSLIEPPEILLPKAEIPETAIPQTGYKGLALPLLALSGLLLCTGVICFLGKNKR